MARRVFFSFHYDRDIWRANQVRNVNTVAGLDEAGFFDHSEYERAKKTADAGISRMILRHLEDTTVTVVLIGMETAHRPWVKYEIEESVKRMNGLLGIRIHHLKLPPDAPAQWGSRSFLSGPLPVVPRNIPFPVYTWDKSVLRFRFAIERAGKQADFRRAVAARRSRLSRPS